MKKPTLELLTIYAMFIRHKKAETVAHDCHTVHVMACAHACFGSHTTRLVVHVGSVCLGFSFFLPIDQIG